MHARLFRRALAATAITTLAAGCGTVAAQPDRGPKKTNLVVMAVPAEGAARLYIAQDDGLLARGGLHVTIKATENPTTDIPTLLPGSVDVLSGQYTACIAAQTAGIARPRILAAGYALGPHVQDAEGPNPVQPGPPPNPRPL